jgi:small-conductance mechanosensitive channel
MSGSWLGPAVFSALALLVVAILFRIAWKLAKRLLRSNAIAHTLIEDTEDPARLLLSLLALQAVWQAAPDSLYLIGAVRHLTAVLLIASITWLIVRTIVAAGRIVVLMHPVDVSDNLHARGIQTQTRVLTRTLMLFVLVFGVACALITFPSVRQIGTGLLASAGLAGLVIGFAAKPLLGNLLAGLQIALTQPIRLDDVVTVEGEFGRIEEITSAYVVVALWDERRMIMPLQWFIEHPFQNWTRTSAQILGSVFLWVDFGFPVEPLRQELAKICEGNPDWDRRVCGIQVTDMSEHAVQLRILVSSGSASRNWDLRCFVRERLIDYIARDHSQYFPKFRIDNPLPMPRPANAVAG